MKILKNQVILKHQVRVQISFQVWDPVEKQVRNKVWDQVSSQGLNQIKHSQLESRR